MLCGGVHLRPILGWHHRYGRRRMGFDVSLAAYGSGRSQGVRPPMYQNSLTTAAPDRYYR